MMKFATKERESNIELLRIVLMLMVITLHYNWPNMGKALAYAYNSDSAASFNFLWIMQSASLGAVNCFIIISGYYSINRTSIKLSKILSLLGTLCIYNLVAYFIGCFVNGFEATFSVQSMFTQSLPINYYLFLYIALYILTPYLNLVVNKLTRKQFILMLIVLLVLFSVWEYGIDIVETVSTGPLDSVSTIGKQGDQGGYTIVNFVLMYLIGTYFRRFDISISINVIPLLLGYFGSVIILSLFKNMEFHEMIWQYNNPLVIIEACTLFLLFNKIKINNKVINGVSTTVLGVFFLHVRSNFMEVIWGGHRIQESIDGGVSATIFTYITSVLLMYLVATLLALVINSTLIWGWNKLCSEVPFIISVHEKDSLD